MDSIAWQKYAWERIWDMFCGGENRVSLYCQGGSIIFSSEAPQGTDESFMIHFHRTDVFPVIPAKVRRLFEDRVNKRIQRGDLYELPPEPMKELQA